MTDILIALGVNVLGNAIGGAIGGVIAYYIIKHWL